MKTAGARSFGRALDPVPLRYFAAVAVVAMGLWFTGGRSLPPVRRALPVLPLEVTRGAAGRHMLALTFDAGGESGYLTDLLAALARDGRHCTFFVTGQWAAQHPDLVREMARNGHEIGNHTSSHRHLTHLPDAEVRAELLDAEKVIVQLTGRSPRPLWRAPFGERDPRVLHIAAQLGYTSIYWSIDSLDSVGEPKTAAFLLNRVSGHADSYLDGAIILMHVGEKGTAEAIPMILADAKSRHLSPVPVTRLMGWQPSARSR